MYLTLEVTENDIKYGKKDNSNLCPLAKALKRQLKRNTKVCISACEWFEVGEWVWGYLSKKAQEFIDRFDNGKTVKPGKFKLLISDSVKQYLKETK